MDEIVNKVASSGLITLDLEELHIPGKRILFDLKDYLFEGLILREKDFRTALLNTDWSGYKGAYVAITCTADAIIQPWAYLLASNYISPVAAKVVFGDLESLESSLYIEKLNHLNLEQFKEGRIVLKGCSKIKVPLAAYVHAFNIIQPIAKSIMYGEPCSTVPLFKRK
jgi:hypothetical protein